MVCCIVSDVQKGWWMIDNFDQVKAVSSSLCTRGIREKFLSRQLNKFSKHLQDGCSSSEHPTGRQLISNLCGSVSLCSVLTTANLCVGV